MKTRYKYKYILAIDPSGNFNEGHGTTGWVLLDHNENLIEKGFIAAKHYKCPEEYWNAHKNLIEHFYKKHRHEIIIVMEEYVLYRERSNSQTNSKMETCRLIGLLQWYCWSINQPYSMQLAVSVKDRWSNELLLREHIFYKDKGKMIHTQSGIPLNSPHIRDAFRHAIHYAVIRNKDNPKPQSYNKGAYNYARSNY